MDNNITVKLSKLINKTCVAFTFIVLSFTLIMYSGAKADTIKLFATTAPMIMSILLFSFVFSLTSLYNEYGKMNQVGKRILHFTINFISLWVCFFLIPNRIKQVTEFIVTSFFFLIIYLAIILIKNLTNKLFYKLNII